MNRHLKTTIAILALMLASQLLGAEDANRDRFAATPWAIWDGSRYGCAYSIEGQRDIPDYRNHERIGDLDELIVASDRVYLTVKVPYLLEGIRDEVTWRKLASVLLGGEIVAAKDGGTPEPTLLPLATLDDVAACNPAPCFDVTATPIGEFVLNANENSRLAIRAPMMIDKGHRVPELLRYATEEHTTTYEFRRIEESREFCERVEDDGGWF